jgi:Bacterial membrane protein YfhO
LPWGRIRVLHWPIGRSRELLLVTAIFVAILAVGFPGFVTESATFAPNGRLATQSGVRRVDYPYPTPDRAVINDGGGFVWDFEPWMQIVHNAYSDGALPLWNPYTMFGAPLAGDIQTAPAAPFYWPLFVHPSQRMWNLVALLRLLVGGVGCFALLRALGAFPAAAFPAAVGFLLAPAFVLWLHAGSMNLDSLAPWLLLAILGFIRRQTASRFAAVAIITTLVCVGGQPEVLIAVTYLAIAWGAYWWIRESRRWRVFAEAVAAAVVGALIAAPLLWLGIQYVQIGATAHRRAEGTGRYALGVIKLFALGDFDQQRQVTLGIVLLSLALAGLIARRSSGVSGMWFMVGALVVWSLRSFAHLPGGLLDPIPGFHEANLKRYGELVVPLAGAVLAAGGIQALMRGSRMAATTASLAVLVPIAIWPAGGPAHSDVGPALLLALVTALAAWAVVRWPWFAPALAFVLFAQFRGLTPTNYTHPYNPFSPRPFAAYVSKHLQPGQRVLGTGNIMPPNVGAAMRIADPRANDALFPERWVRYMVGLVGGTTGSVATSRTDSPLLNAAGVRYLLVAPGVRPPGSNYHLAFRSPPGTHSPSVWVNTLAYPKAWIPQSIVVVANESSDQHAIEGAAGRDLRARSIVEDPTPAMRSAHGTGSATIAHYGWNDLTLRVHATGNAVLITSDTYFPGWDATVDGHATPIRPANVAMRAIAVPTGDHTVTLRYDPPQFRYGVLLTLIGLAALVARLLGRRLVPARYLPVRSSDAPIGHQRVQPPATTAGLTRRDGH